MNVNQRLLAIQAKMKAPKSNQGDRIRYKYRTVDQILENVKPLLLENECSIHIYDEIVEHGERLFIKSSAYIVDVGTGDKSEPVTAYAEICMHPSMSADQCTGTASTYARKYALNALLLLDDGKDSDAMANSKLICSTCGVEITDNGTQSAWQVYHATKGRCINCYNTAYKKWQEDKEKSK